MHVRNRFRHLTFDEQESSQRVQTSAKSDQKVFFSIQLFTILHVCLSIIYVFFWQFCGMEVDRGNWLGKRKAYGPMWTYSRRWAGRCQRRRWARARRRGTWAGRRHRSASPGSWPSIASWSPLRRAVLDRRRSVAPPPTPTTSWWWATTARRGRRRAAEGAAAGNRQRLYIAAWPGDPRRDGWRPDSAPAMSLHSSPVSADVYLSASLLPALEKRTTHDWHCNAVLWWRLIIFLFTDGETDRQKDKPANWRTARQNITIRDGNEDSVA